MCRIGLCRGFGEEVGAAVNEGSCTITIVRRFGKPKLLDFKEILTVLEQHGFSWSMRYLDLWYIHTIDPPPLSLWTLLNMKEVEEKYLHETF